MQICFMAPSPSEVPTLNKWTYQISGYVRVSSPVVFARAWYKKIPFKHAALFTERAHCELWVNYELGKWQNFFGSCLEFCFWHTCVGNLLELINVAPSLLVYETILDKLAAEYYSPEIWHPEYIKFIIKFTKCHPKRYSLAQS